MKPFDKIVKEFPQLRIIVEKNYDSNVILELKQFINDNFVERGEIIKKIPIDKNAKLGGILNFASWGIIDSYTGFIEGFRRGYNCHTEETIKALKPNQLEKE